MSSEDVEDLLSVYETIKGQQQEDEGADESEDEGKSNSTRNVGRHASNQRPKTPKKDLLTEMGRLSEKLGKWPTAPTKREMNDKGRYSATLYDNRFGLWSNAVDEAGLQQNSSGPAPKNHREDTDQ